MSNLDFTLEEIVEGILEDIKEFQDDEGLNFLQAVTKIIVEYDRLIRYNHKNKRNVFLTLKILCDREQVFHESVEEMIEKLNYDNDEYKQLVIKNINFQSPPPMRA